MSSHRTHLSSNDRIAKIKLFQEHSERAKLHKNAFESLRLHGTITEDFSSIKHGDYSKDEILFTGQVLVMTTWWEPDLAKSGIRVSPSVGDGRTGNMLSSPDKTLGAVVIQIPANGATRCSLSITDTNPDAGGRSQVQWVAPGRDPNGSGHLHTYHSMGKVIKLEAYACPGDTIQLIVAALNGFELSNLEFDMA